MIEWRNYGFIMAVIVLGVWAFVGMMSESMWGLPPVIALLSWATACAIREHRRSMERLEARHKAEIEAEIDAISNAETELTLLWSLYDAIRPMESNYWTESYGVDAIMDALTAYRKQMEDDDGELEI